MSTSTYRCAYCGSTQTWDGTGARVCTQCGATQPDTPSTAAATPATSRRVWPWLLLVAVAAAVAGFFIYQSQKTTPGNSATTGTSSHPATRIGSRIVVVDSVQVREVSAGSDLSALDLLRSSPANTAALFDTRMLSFAQPRGMNSTDGSLYFVGEVVNHSPDFTAMAPSATISLVKRGHVIETSDLNFSDLPPGGHSPAFFTWDGEPNDFDHVEIHWKPVQGYRTAGPNHPHLQTTITDRKTQPGSVTVNFSYTFHFVTATVKGTVVNHGDATASGIQLYLTLRDAQGRVTGYKEKDLGQLAPGQSVDYELDADQWAEPVASIDVEALAASEPILQ